MTIPIEKKQLARASLVKSAKHSCNYIGISRYEWETEPEIIAYAQKYGIEDELKHISAWAFKL